MQQCVGHVYVLRAAETTIIIKFAFWRGLGRGKFYGKLSPNAVFPEKFHDNKIWIRSHPGKPNQIKASSKMGEIHELFVLALSLVWFAGVTPDLTFYQFYCHKFVVIWEAPMFVKFHTSLQWLCTMQAADVYEQAVSARIEPEVQACLSTFAPLLKRENFVELFARIVRDILVHSLREVAPRASSR